jgi:hypothetical protein
VHQTDLESGGGRFPATFFPSFQTRNPKNELSGRKKRTNHMNRLIQLKTTALLTTIALAIIMGSAVRAAQIGDSVQDVVPIDERVNVPGSRLQDMPTTVAEITLDSGVWSISGQINMGSPFVAMNTLLFIAGNISLDEPSFEPRGTAAVSRTRATEAGSLIGNMALVPRVVEVEDGTHVFLVAGNFNPSLTDLGAWGFITAVKIRNHVN